MKPVWFVVLAVTMLAQAPPQTTTKQLMLDMIHPAANDILLFVNRGAPKSEQEWAVARRSGLTLAESGNLLLMPGRAREGDWTKDAKTLADVGTAAYQAAQAKDFPSLAGLTDALDASCTTCHKQFRPNVFPKAGEATGGSK
jgi:hypothetical protein